MASKQTITIILWVLIAIFLAGIVYMNVPNSGKTKPGGNNLRPGGVNKTLVTINGQAIDSDTFEQAYIDSSQGAQSQELGQTLPTRSKIAKNLVMNAVADQVLRGYGIRNVNKKANEIAGELSTMFYDQVRKAAEGQAQQEMAMAKDKKTVKTPQQYLNEQLSQMYLQQGVQPPAQITEDSFRKFYTETLTDPKFGQADDFMLYVRKRLIGEQIMKRDLPADLVSEAYAKKLATQQVNARWIFIPAGSMQNIFKPEFSAAALQAAQKKATDLRAQIAKDPASFAKVASKESQHISHTEGGNLGWVSGGTMSANIPAILEYLIFSQQPKELGPVTQITMPGPDATNPLAAQVGYGFVQVIAVSKNPDNPNWAQMRTEYMDTTKRRYAMQLGEGYLCYMIANADIKYNSKEFESYIAEGHGQYIEMTKLQKEALDEKDLPRPVIAALSYLVAISSPDIKGEAKIPLLKAALEYAGGSRSDLHMQLAETYRAVGKKTEAIEQYENAMNSAGMGEANLRKQVRTIYVQMGNTEGVKAIDQWLAEHKDAAPNK